MGDVVADPSGSWTSSTAQQYIDSQIATVNTNLANETIGRQNGDRNLQTQLQSEMNTRADQDANLNALINAGIREGGGVQFDTVPIQNSANGITSGGMYSTLKDSNIGFVDDEPTAGSDNLVKSGGVCAYIGNIEVTKEAPNNTWIKFADVDIKAGDKFHVKVNSNVDWTRIIIAYNGDSENRLTDWVSTRTELDAEYIAPVNITSLECVVLVSSTAILEFKTLLNIALQIDKDEKEIQINSNNINNNKISIEGARTQEKLLGSLIFPQKNLFNYFSPEIEFFSGIKGKDYPFYNISKCVVDNDDIHNDNNYHTTHFVKVESGEQYVCNLAIRVCAFYDENFNQLPNTFISTEISARTPFTIPSNAVYLRASIANYHWTYANKMAINKGTTIVNNGKPYGINGGIQLSPLNGKKVYNFGDSIAAGDGNGGKGYAEILGEMFGCIVTDYAIGGATISKIEGQSMSSIIDQINNASSEIPDVIIIDGGGNDYTQSRPMGEMTQIRYVEITEWNYDIETFLGGVEQCFYLLRHKYPSTPIVYLYIHQDPSRWEKTIDVDVKLSFYEMHDKVLEVCRKWAVMVCDVFTEGQMNTNIIYQKEHYTNNADGTHPNQEGYELFYIPLLKEKVETVIRKV